LFLEQSRSGDPDVTRPLKLQPLLTPLQPRSNLILPFRNILKRDPCTGPAVRVHCPATRGVIIIPVYNEARLTIVRVLRNGDLESYSGGSWINGVELDRNRRGVGG
jgi:hypothetical protein